MINGSHSLNIHKNDCSKNIALLLSVIAIIALFSTTAFAFEAPQEGEFFYELFDILVLKLIEGPAGYVVSIMLVMGAIVTASMGKGILLPVIMFVSGAMIFSARKLTESFGFSFDFVDSIIPSILPVL